jgi:hypothetical protein
MDQEGEGAAEAVKVRHEIILSGGARRRTRGSASLPALGYFSVAYALGTRCRGVGPNASQKNPCVPLSSPRFGLMQS